MSLSPRRSRWRGIFFFFIKHFEGGFVFKGWAEQKQPPADLSGSLQVESLQVSASRYEPQTPSNAFHWRPQTSLILFLLRSFLTVFSRSFEVCFACRVSSLAVVSRGGVLVDSWGIWRPQEPRCPVCRSPCRWPSSRTGLRPFQPRWHWRTREESPGTPPGIVQEPEGERGKGSGQRRRERGRKKEEIMSDTRASIVSTEGEFPFNHLLSWPKCTIQYLWVKNTELCYFCMSKPTIADCANFCSGYSRSSTPNWENNVCLDLSLYKMALPYWSRKGPPPNLSHKLEAHHCLEYHCIAVALRFPELELRSLTQTIKLYTKRTQTHRGVHIFFNHMMYF